MKSIYFKTAAFVFVMLLVVSCKDDPTEPYSNELAGTAWLGQYDSHQGIHTVLLHFDDAIATQTTYSEDGSVIVNECHAKYSYNKPNVIVYDSVGNAITNSSMVVVNKNTMVWTPNLAEEEPITFIKQ